MLDVSGKKALVTGGTRGIGRDIVLTLARAGMDVVTCSRQGGDAADSLVRQLKHDTDGNHHVMQADVSRPDDLDRLVEECRTRYGHLDAIVHNAGVISHIPFDKLPPDEWARVLDTNLTAVFLLIQKALPLMGEGSSIVTVGSKVATVGVPLRAHYTAAKAGVIGFTRSLAKELGPKGIRVNIVAPGPIETEADVPQEVVDRYTAMIPLGRLGQTSEIATTTLFLISDLASFVNGETIQVDGGI